MKTKQVDPSSIKIGGRFREEIGDISDLVESIKEKGFISHIIIDNKDNLIAGERRLEAAKEVGLRTIPAIIRDTTSEIDAREIELIENAVRKDFTWQERAKLENHIMELKKEQDPEWGIAQQSKYMNQSVGATHRRLALAVIIDKVPEIGDSRTEVDAWKKYKQLEEAVVLKSIRDDSPGKYEGAVKHATDHYIVGDALEGLKGINTGAVHFAEVDPPYAVELKKSKSRAQDLKRLDHYNEIDAKDYPAFVQTVAKEVFRILRPNTFCVWWFGHTWYSEVLATLRGVGFSVSDIPGIWSKTNTAGQTASPDTMLGSAYEPFFVCRKEKPKLVKPGRKNVFEFSPTAPQLKIHPTERPIELMLEIVDTFCYPSSIVCVPFLGSGVTLRALYLRGSVGYGWELDKMCKERFLNAVFKDQQNNDKPL